MPREITMGGEITMAPETIMNGEIMMRRSQQTAVMGHGMDALRAGRFRVETARPTKVRSVADGARGTAARAVTRFKAASVSRILDAKGCACRPDVRRARPFLKQSQSRLSSEPPFRLPRFPRRRYATRHKLGIQRHTGYKGHEIATLERDT
jgi:hypothetical protein